MKKGVTFFVFICLLVFGVSACGRENVSDPSEGKKASAENPKTTDRSSEESEQTSEQTEASVSAEEHSGQTDIQKPVKKDILIAIDPGHQSPDIDMSGQEPNAPGSGDFKQKSAGGTVGRFTGIPEYELNLEIALMLRDRLTEQGYDVILTRENNETAISNAERACLANDAGAEFSLRIHANGSEDPSVNGAMALIGSAENPYVGGVYEESYRLAETILNCYCSASGMQNLGIRCNDTMTGINWSKIPVTIVEMGFMSNPEEDQKLSDNHYQSMLAEGIADGVDRYYQREGEKNAEK